MRSGIQARFVGKNPFIPFPPSPPSFPLSLLRSPSLRFLSQENIYPYLPQKAPQTENEKQRSENYRTKNGMSFPPTQKNSDHVKGAYTSTPIHDHLGTHAKPGIPRTNIKQICLKKREHL